MIEATSSGFHLAHCLHEQGFALSAINSIRTRRYAENTQWFIGNARHHRCIAMIGALRYNARIWAYYDQVKARCGKHKLVAIGAARKLIHTIWAIDKRDTPFDPECATKLQKQLSVQNQENHDE